MLHIKSNYLTHKHSMNNSCYLKKPGEEKVEKSIKREHISQYRLGYVIGTNDTKISMT